MNKKIIGSCLAVICLIIGGFGLNAFAFPSSAPSSASVTGTFKELSADLQSLVVRTDQGDKTIAIATSNWAYRNDQKAQLSDFRQGDTVEVILNSKDQAAYVKAFAADATPVAAGSEQPQTQQQPSLAPASPVLSSSQPSERTEPTTSAGTAPLNPAKPPSVPTDSKQTDDQVLDRLSLKIEGQHFSLELKKNAGQGSSDDLKIKSKESGNVHVKGEVATQWITQLLAGTRLTEQNAKEQLLNAIAAQYKEDKSKLSVKFDAKWLPVTHAVGLDSKKEKHGASPGGNGEKKHKDKED